MATIKIVLGIICLAIFGRTIEPNGYFLGGSGFDLGGKRFVHTLATAKYKLPAENCQLLMIAQSQIGVRELSGKNDGLQVEAYLHYTYNKKGEPWCASFVSWVFGKVGLREPRTAWSPALFPSNKLEVKPAPAFVFGIYFPSLKRIAHCGLIERQKGNWLYTIEGNTNIAGGREGDGVYRKLRHVATIRLYANWLSNNGKEVVK